MRSPVCLAVAVLLASGCRSTPSTMQPSAQSPTAEVGGVVARGTPADTGRRRHTDADAQFFRQMIGHHAQALEMTKLVPSRSSRDDLKLLSQRIDVSQQDEIALMRQWLQQRGEALPAPDAHHHAAMGHGQLMPGMLTAAELERLAKATGTEFDRLFLEGMIRHHEGAITMVKSLFGTQGAAQETETYRFATDVEADQRAEIARMRALLAKLPR